LGCLQDASSCILVFFFGVVHQLVIYQPYIVECSKTKATNLVEWSTVSQRIGGQLPDPRFSPSSVFTSFSRQLYTSSSPLTGLKLFTPSGLKLISCRRPGPQIIVIFLFPTRLFSLDLCLPTPSVWSRNQTDLEPNQ
jgi:hypothetical protein